MPSSSYYATDGIPRQAPLSWLPLRLLPPGLDSAPGALAALLRCQLLRGRLAPRCSSQQARGVSAPARARMPTAGAEPTRPVTRRPSRAAPAAPAACTVGPRSCRYLRFAAPSPRSCRSSLKASRMSRRRSRNRRRRISARVPRRGAETARPAVARLRVPILQDTGALAHEKAVASGVERLAMSSIALRTLAPRHLTPVASPADTSSVDPRICSSSSASL